jgi:hypothetical protein
MTRAGLFGLGRLLRMFSFHESRNSSQVPETMLRVYSRETSTEVVSKPNALHQHFIAVFGSCV